jgi:hypothetical protein
MGLYFPIGPTWQRRALHPTVVLASRCACTPAAPPQRHLHSNAPRPRRRGCIRAWALGTGSRRARRIRTHLQRLRAPPSWWRPWWQCAEGPEAVLGELRFLACLGILVLCHLEVGPRSRGCSPDPIELGPCRPLPPLISCGTL